MLFGEGRRESELIKMVNKNEIEMCSRVLATDKHFKDPWFYLTSFCYVCDLLKAREASS